MVINFWRVLMSDGRGLMRGRVDFERANEGKG